MPTRKTTLRTDPRGDYRPYIGRREDGKSPRFNLGKSLPEAEIRAERIRQLYLESEAVRMSYGQPPTWTAAALHAAKLIQHGHQQIPLPSAHVINEAAGDGPDIGGYRCDWSDDDPNAVLWSHAVASRHYPSVNWILPDNASGREALKRGTAAFEDQANRHARMLGVKTAPKPITGTLHEALDAYERHIESELAANLERSTVEQRKSQVKYLKRQHEDRPLALLDLDQCKSLYGFWTSVPKRTESEHYSRSTCKHRVSELSMFFDWLHTTILFDWRKPEDYDTISKKIKKLPGKRKSIREIVAKKTFQVEHLATINQHCTVLERLILYLGLNCCFGAAESGRLEEGDLFLHQENPIGHLWQQFDFTSSEEDSWIGYLRPKTEVAGMWWLWPETVAVLEQWLEERPPSQSSRIIVTSTGKSLYRDESKNAQSGFQNMWTNLRERAQAKDSSIPSFAFGTLRDQFSDWLVYKHKSETASIALAHGTPFKDDLMLCYANLPFPTLFEEQREYRNFMQPVFDAVR